MLPIILTDFVEDINSGNGKSIAKLLSEISCEKCGLQELKLTGSLIPRQAVTLGETASILVPLSKCAGCEARRRLLPMDLLPGKTYSLPVIEKFISAYTTGPSGLRRTVKETEAGSFKPNFTTLHGWCGGLGERALDQVRLSRKRAALKDEPLLAPFTALLQTLETNCGLPAAEAFARDVRVDPVKYLSQRRREHLEADRRVLNVAALIPSPPARWEPKSLLNLEAEGLREFRSPMLLFRSRIRDTAIQRGAARKRRYKGHP